MLQNESTINVADNSGARKLKILSVPGYSRKKYIRLGDVVSAVVKEATPHTQIQEDAKVQAVIVRVRKEYRRIDGSYIRFDDNAAVVISKGGDPVGTRVLGPVAREIKEKGFKKVASLAKEVW
jgi:large subunit ribosomal protein L14